MRAFVTRAFLIRTAALALICVPGLSARAAEPVKSIDIYVQPYYESARSPGDAPRVAVGRSFDGLLSSTKREDIVAARDKVLADPKLVTPMTMMVLAVRLYDVGLRDDAVFWFYAAKDRFITLSEVIDVPSSGLAQAEDAVRSFAALAGPVINGYAFCDLARQKDIRAKELDWVEANPYGVIFMTQLRAKPGDRNDNLQRAMRDIRASAGKERSYFDDPKNVSEFFATRKANGADVKFCWP